MTHDEFMALVQQPQEVKASNIADLRELTGYYPYFVFPRLLLAGAMHQTQHIHSTQYTQQAVLYAADHRWLYYYLYPERRLSSGTVKNERSQKYSGNYFDLLNVVESEGGDSRKSLKNLAEQLREAREMVADNKKNTKPVAIRPPAEAISQPQPASQPVDEAQTNEDIAKKLIKERKYAEAIDVLNKLILINPKKSIYFADQIRFLEKALENSKK
jgi:hypothetical protein